MPPGPPREVRVTCVKYMTGKDPWRDQKGNLFTKVTPEESIEILLLLLTQPSVYGDV